MTLSCVALVLAEATTIRQVFLTCKAPTTAIRPGLIWHWVGVHEEPGDTLFRNRSHDMPHERVHQLATCAVLVANSATVRNVDWRSKPVSLRSGSHGLGIVSAEPAALDRPGCELKAGLHRERSHHHLHPSADGSR